MFCFFALDDDFAGVVGDDVNLVAFVSKASVVDVVGLPELLGAMGVELLELRVGELEGVEGFLFRLVCRLVLAFSHLG